MRNVSVYFTLLRAAICIILLYLPALFLAGTVNPANAQLVQMGGKLVGTGAVGTANQDSAVSISSDGNTQSWMGISTIVIQCIGFRQDRSQRRRN